MVTSTEKYKELARLLCAGQKGDSLAYAQFLNHVSPILLRMVARRVGAADVEDIVQEILISMHKARHTYDGERPIMPWIVAIARFRISDHLRKHYAQMQHQTTDIAELENILADVTEVPADHESMIDELLQDVPEKHKHILTLMHMQGFTAKEVGAKLNMKESAVKVAAHRAMKKIRDKFAI